MILKTVTIPYNSGDISHRINVATAKQEREREKTLGIFHFTIHLFKLGFIYKHLAPSIAGKKHTKQSPSLIMACIDLDFFEVFM